MLRQSHQVSKATIARRMRKMGIKALAKKKFRVTTNSSHKFSRSPNLLKRLGSPTEINQVWASDITYIWTKEGWMYLCVVMDLFSRKVVGWSLKNTLKTTIVKEALNAAILMRGCAKGVVFHSDQGIQYASRDFRELLERHGFIQSMSDKGNCYDNALVESFFHSLKVEEIHPREFFTREELTVRVFQWIECFYNRRRLHSSLGYKSPLEFEMQLNAA